MCSDRPDFEIWKKTRPKTHISRYLNQYHFLHFDTFALYHTIIISRINIIGEIMTLDTFDEFGGRVPFQPSITRPVKISKLKVNTAVCILLNSFLLVPSGTNWFGLSTLIGVDFDGDPSCTHCKKENKRQFHYFFRDYFLSWNNLTRKNCYEEKMRKKC